MIRKNQAFLNRVNIILDMLLVILSYMLASWFRLDFFDGQSENMAAIRGSTLLLAVAYSLMLFFILSMFVFITRPVHGDWSGESGPLFWV